jgi:hypothetical protein
MGSSCCLTLNGSRPAVKFFRTTNAANVQASQAASLPLAGRPKWPHEIDRSYPDDHVDRLLAEVTPMLGYLSRLSARMDKRGMGTEPLAATVRNAQQAMPALCMALHHLHCEGLGDRANKH